MLDDTKIVAADNDYFVTKREHVSKKIVHVKISQVLLLMMFDEKKPRLLLNGYLRLHPDFVISILNWLLEKSGNENVKPSSEIRVCRHATSV